MDGPAKLPPDYVSLAQLQERWLQKQQREKETGEKPRESESELNDNREPPDYVSRTQLQDRCLEKQQQRDKETGEKTKEEKKDSESGLNESREKRLPPDYVSPAQLQERWIQKQQRVKESAGLSKSGDRRDKKASYEDKGNWKEMPIEGSENGEEIRKRIMSDEAGKGIEIDKEKLKIETDNGGTKRVLSVVNNGDGGLKGEMGDGNDFNTKRGINHRGRFNQLKETQVHKMGDKNGYNKNWIEKRRNGNNGGDKESSYRLKKPEIERKSDNENLKVCSEIDIRRDVKNDRDDHVAERERLNGKKAEEKMILAVESMKISESGCNNNRKRGFQKRRNGNNSGDKEGSYRLNELELEKKSDNESLKVCSEIDVRRDVKNDRDDHVAERERLNGKKAEEEMILAVESMKISESGCNNNRKRGFQKRRNGNNSGDKEGSYRLNELELEKISDNESLKVCSEIDVRRDVKNDRDDHVAERERLNGKKAEEEMILAVESMKISESGCNNNRKRGFQKRRNGNNSGDKEGSYRLNELELEKKSDNESLKVCSEIDVRRDGKNDRDDHVVEREGLHGKKAEGEMILALESVKISENGCNNNGRRGGFGNRRNVNNHGALEGSYRLKELGLEKKSINEKQEVCSEIDVRRNDSDDHVVESEGLSGKKAEEEMILRVESVKIGENGYTRRGNKKGRGFGNRRNSNHHDAREGSYRSKELGLEKKPDNEKSEVIGEVDARRERKNGSDDDIVEMEGLNDKKVNTKMILAVESVKIGEKRYNNNGRRGFGNQRNDSKRGAREGSYRVKELRLEKKSNNEKSEVYSVISSINDVSSGGNSVSDDHIAERERLNDNVSEKAEEEIVLAVETGRICENAYSRHEYNKRRILGGYWKSNDSGHRRYAGPMRFGGRRETKEREVRGMVWVKKEDKPGIC